MRRKVIILLGLPGSGKGTQGGVLAKNMNIPHISTGDILREMASGSGTDAQELRDKMQAGKLISSELVNKIVADYLESDLCKDGCILDGYPRNIEQARYLQDRLDADINVLFFSIDDQIVIKRITDRYSCADCGELYNKSQDKSLRTVCVKCGGSNFSYRQDDNESTVVMRINEYKKETMPLVQYYKEKGVLSEVDANLPKEEVAKEVLASVKRV